MQLSGFKNAKNFRKTKSFAKALYIAILPVQSKAFYTKLLGGVYVFSACCILFLVQPICCSAQLNNKAFYWQKPLQPQDSGKLSVEVRTLGFSRNNEYFSDFADGYTLFGYLAQSALRWQPNQHILVEAGLFARKDFGNNDLTTIQPTFQLQARFDSLRFIFGTLEGSVEHQLIEPMYDFERIMLDRIEEGVQVIYNKPALWADVWIDWEKMIYAGDNAQEEVSGGASVRFRLREKNKFTAWLPLQFIAYHKGGQIDSSPDPLVTRVNGAAGVEFKYDVSSKFLKAWRFQPYVLAYRDASNVLKQRYEDGFGLYLNAAAETHLGNFMLTYWKGNEYVPIKGAPLFSSYSLTYDNPGFISNERELLMLRILNTFPVGDYLNIVLRLEPFYDFGAGRADFSNSIYVTYRQNFSLKK